VSPTLVTPLVEASRTCFLSETVVKLRQSALIKERDDDNDDSADDDDDDDEL